VKRLTNPAHYRLELDGQQYDAIDLIEAM